MINPKRKETNSTSWGEVTSWYDQYVGQEGSNFHQTIILPGVKKLLNIDKHKDGNYNLIDLACGQGVLERYLAPFNIHQVGIEISKELVELAKQRNTGDNVRYYQGDVTKLIDENGNLIHGLEKASFDGVTIILAIQNITPLSAVWKACYELLKPKGALVIVMMHPSFRIPQSGDWQWNEKDDRQERVMWNYLSSHEVEIKTNPGKAASKTNTIHFHRPLQAYINTLGNASLYVDHIEEWASNVPEQTGIKSEALLKAKKEFPLFLAIRARKVN